MMDSRAAFEAWIRGTKCSAVRLTIIDNEYVSEPVQFAWEGWCAATERAAKVCDEHASIEGIAQACAAAIRQSQS